MYTNFTKLEKYLDTMPERGIPLCNLAVSFGNDIVYKHSVNCTDDTLFWCYSTSKISVCTGAMRLVEEGKIELDAPVAKYIPAFEKMTLRTEGGIVPVYEPLKIWHLFTMTGGFNYDTDTPELIAANDACLGTVGVIEALAKTPLLFVPGTHFEYGMCHDILGAVIEVVSQMTLAEYLKKYVYEPLGMHDTGFDPSEEQRKRFAPMYRYNSGSGRSVPIEPVKRVYENPNYYSGGGGVFSSTSDYIKLMNTLALGGTSPNGYRLLKEETVEMMEKNYLDKSALVELRSGRFYCYGYGWGLCGRVHIDPASSMSLSSKGEFGWNSASCHYASADRAKGVGLYFGTHVFGCNYGYNVLHPLLKNMVYEALGFGETIY